MNAILRSSPESATELGTAPHVVIIGGGFTGALQAINLLRYGAATATIVERRAHPGRGIAYSAAHRDHVLNVRAGNMSAFPDDSDHFVRWLSQRHAELASGFAPRLVYGDYLAELLAEATAASGGRLAIVEGEARDVSRDGERARVHLAGGRTLEADAVVLAVGNLMPYSPAGLGDAALPSDVYAQCPWTQPIATGLADDDTVLTIGTGLTMIDVALMLEAEGFKGKIVALSRRGLAPRAHAGAVMAPSKLKVAPRSACAHLVRCVRARADAVGWHAAVDELRPFTQAMWRDADLTQRRRFLRHLRPWWDVHRHHIAPQVAEKIARMQADGRLEIAGGKLVSVAAQETGNQDTGTQVTWRARGARETRSLAVRRIINCTGPQGDLLATEEPLLRGLLARGLIRPDRLRIGIDVDELSQAVDRDGSAQPWLLALGPITRGAFWEIVAVPDIRHQTWAVARRLADQLAVGADRLGA